QQWTPSSAASSGLATVPRSTTGCQGLPRPLRQQQAGADRRRSRLSRADSVPHRRARPDGPGHQRCHNPPEIASEIFYSVAHLLNLDVDIVFAVTTSAYWEMEVAAEPAEAAAGDEDEDEDSLPEEEGARLFGHSKDHRDDLPQVVIAMAVTRDGIPVRCWTFPGNTGDQKIIRKVKDDLAGWNLRRLVWVAD